MSVPVAHLECLDAGLLLLEGLLLLLLVHAAEGHACVGEGRHSAGQGVGPVGGR